MIEWTLGMEIMTSGWKIARELIINAFQKRVNLDTVPGRVCMSSGSRVSELHHPQPSLAGIIIYYQYFDDVLRENI
jgi:hypothetical protein